MDSQSTIDNRKKCYIKAILFLIAAIAIDTAAGLDIVIGSGLGKQLQSFSIILIGRLPRESFSPQNIICYIMDNAGAVALAFLYA